MNKGILLAFRKQNRGKNTSCSLNKNSLNQDPAEGKKRENHRKQEGIEQVRKDI